jgi:ABC-type glycerol-3-phosphate transport system substrate-binding protein
VVLFGSVASGCGGVEVLGREQPSSCQLADYATAGEGEPPEVVTVATFWGSDVNEAKALDVLTDRADSLVPVILEAQLNDRAEQQQTLNAWLIDDAGDLPDAYQVNGGSDVLQWVFENDAENSELCLLDRVAERYGMFERYFEAALAPVSCQGQLFAVPIGIHRVNVLMYSKRALARLEEKASAEGIALPSIESLTSSEEFLDYLELAGSLGVENDAGAPLVPLSVGHSGTWPLTILAFDNMLAGSPGAEYEATWMGRPNGETDDELRPGLERLASQLGRLAPLSNLAERLTWQDATRAVGRGDALFLVMGDWALAQLDDDEREAVAIRPFPGTEDTFVYTPDSFSVPRRDGDDGAAAHLLIREVLDHQPTQLSFARTKQAIPAVRGLDDDALAALQSDYLADSYRRFEACQDAGSECRLLLAVSGLAPAPGADPCFDEVGYLLSRITGVQSQGERDGLLPDSERTCPTPLPSTTEEAQEQLVELLLRLSRTAYAAECR